MYKMKKNKNSVWLEFWSRTFVVQSTIKIKYNKKNVGKSNHSRLFYSIGKFKLPIFSRFCPWSLLNISFQQKMRKNNRFRNVYLKKNCHRINTFFKLNFWRQIRYFCGVFCTQESDNPPCNAKLRNLRSTLIIIWYHKRKKVSCIHKMFVVIVSYFFFFYHIRVLRQ